MPDGIPRDRLDIRFERLGEHFDKHHIHLGDAIYLVLHRFAQPDLGAPHDHPRGFHSMVIKGSYVEQVFQPDGFWWNVHRKRGDAFYIPAKHIHRIIQLPEGECWTAVLYGPPEQDVRFYPELLKGASHG